MKKKELKRQFYEEPLMTNHTRWMWACISTGLVVITVSVALAILLADPLYLFLLMLVVIPGFIGSGIDECAEPWAIHDEAWKRITRARSGSAKEFFQDLRKGEL